MLVTGKKLLHEVRPGRRIGQAEIRRAGQESVQKGKAIPKCRTHGLTVSAADRGIA